MIYLTQWQWRTEDDWPHWDVPRPDICIGRLDLRSRPQRALQGDVQGYVLASYSEDPGSIGTKLADSYGGTIKNADLRTLEKSLGLGERLSSKVFNDVVAELLLQHADAAAQTRWRPLIKPTRGNPVILMKGLPIWTGTAVDVFDTTIAVYRVDYARHKIDGMPIELLRKMTGAKMLRLWGRMGDDLLEPLLGPYASDGWVTPDTEFSDDFNRANSNLDGSSLSGGTGTWTEWAGTDYTVDTNTVLCDGYSGAVGARTGNTSDDDVYAQIYIDTYTYNSDIWAHGPICRKTADGVYTYYRCAGVKTSGSDQHSLTSFVSGAETTLDTYAQAVAADTTLKVEANGSAIKGYIDGTERMSATDTDITGNLQIGFQGYQNDAGNVARLDDFLGGDLGVAQLEGPLVGGRLIRGGTLVNKGALKR